MAGGRSFLPILSKGWHPSTSARPTLCVAWLDWNLLILILPRHAMPCRAAPRNMLRGASRHKPLDATPHHTTPHHTTTLASTFLPTSFFSFPNPQLEPHQVRRGVLPKGLAAEDSAGDRQAARSRLQRGLHPQPPQLGRHRVPRRGACRAGTEGLFYNWSPSTRQGEHRRTFLPPSPPSPSQLT